MYTVRYFLNHVYMNIDSVDKRYFVAHVLGVEVSQVIYHMDKRLDTAQYALLQQYCQHRLQGAPVDKIIGIKGFWHGVFYVDETVLSPRPDTETVIESVLACCPEPPKNILDMGTGSGCIIISLLHQYPTARGVAVDISRDALKMAQKNADFHQLGHRITYVQSDWWDCVPRQTPFDIIVSNPPYIRSQDITSLQPEVRNYDPIQALDGGRDGMSAYGALADIPAGMLADGGYMVVELGIHQHRQVADIFTNNGWTLYAQHTDIAHIIRVQVYQR